MKTCELCKEHGEKTSTYVELSLLSFSIAPNLFFFKVRVRADDVESAPPICRHSLRKPGVWFEFFFSKNKNLNFTKVKSIGLREKSVLIAACGAEETLPTDPALPVLFFSWICIKN